MPVTSLQSSLNERIAITIEVSENSVLILEVAISSIVGNDHGKALTLQEVLVTNEGCLENLR